MSLNVEDLLVSFYKENRTQKPSPIEYYNNIELAVMGNYGIGDAAIITQLLRKANEVGRDLQITARSPLFSQIAKYIPNFHQGDIFGKSFVQVEEIERYNYGNGHIIQKMQRAFGFEADLKPKGYLITSESKKKKICLHLIVKPSSTEFHNPDKRPRQIYPENYPALQEFINKYSNEFSFVELGHQFSFLQNVINKCGTSLDESILELQDSEYFIGLNSGLMNVAAALDIKSIIVTNFPSGELLYLPALSDAPITDLTWSYPQNVHLSQEGSNPLAPAFSLYNLEKAINGEIYPFWEDKYLSLINNYQW